MNQIVKEDIINILNSKTVPWEKFRGKHILITGSSGMIPSYLVLVLIMLNEINSYHIKLFLLFRNLKKAQNIFKDYLKKDYINILLQDVCDPISIDDPIDYIIHGASNASPKYYGTDPVGTARANIIGTDNLLQLAKNKKVDSFLFLSSSLIYGELTDENTTIFETDRGMIDPLDVRNCYGESKRAGENLCIDYYYQYGLNVKIARVFHTLGPFLDLNDSRAFSDICKSFVKNKNIILRSNGSAKRTFLYVVDAIEALLMILTKGENGEAYNVGSQLNEISIKELAHILIGCYPEKNIKVEYNIDPNSIAYSKMKNPVNIIIPETQKLQNLGWKEKFGLTETFTRTIDAISMTLKLG
ncbi:MAG: NAD-dependent epimerase/dehydratase family protein [Muribaculaceae bacterium]|nr:NAD-dependent epimerase/dehydratase family protein [Muribaculaceae bacterium]